MQEYEDCDQELYLEQHIEIVRQQSFHMKKSLDQGNLREALKFSSTMLAEMKTSKLTPRNYFNLYMMVFDELEQLQQHFIDEHKRGRKMADLYESVQHAGSVIPRLYLLVTVGAAYVKTKEAPVKLILSDLLDMVKGV
jgi:vacuolar protein sorting-associated protein 35